MLKSLFGLTKRVFNSLERGRQTSPSKLIEGELISLEHALKNSHRLYKKQSDLIATIQESTVSIQPKRSTFFPRRELHLRPRGHPIKLFARA